MNPAEIIELESCQLLVKKMAPSSEDAITQWFLGYLKLQPNSVYLNKIILPFIGYGINRNDF